MAKAIQLNSANLPVKLVVQQEGGRLGIENVKLIVTVVTTFFVDLIQILKNKDYLNLINLIFNVIKQGNIIALAKMAWEEIKDASLEETNDIHLHFAQVLDLDNEKTEQLIERAFHLIPEVYEIALKGVALFGEVKGLFGNIKDIFSGNEMEVDEVDASLLLAA